MLYDLTIPKFYLIKYLYMLINFKQSHKSIIFLLKVSTVIHGN
jgi:hypothetical protein